MFQDFKSEIKLFAIVAVICFVVATGAILLLNKDQVVQVPEEEIDLAEKPTVVGEDLRQDERILKTLSFEDSTGVHKVLEVGFALPQGRILYLIDEASEQRKSILQVGFATIGESPFISIGSEKFIVVERSGPGDTQNLVILDEQGSIIADTLDDGQYPKLLGYQVSFEEWVNGKHFSAHALSYGQGPPTLKLVIDASTGNISEQHAVEGGSSLKPAKAQTPVAGVCGDSGLGDVASFSIGLPDNVPMPRCLVVRADERLQITNMSNETVTVTLGRIQMIVGPRATKIDTNTFGSYLAPGVHSVSTSLFFGPEVWLK